MREKKSQYLGLRNKNSARKMKTLRYSDAKFAEIKLSIRRIKLSKEVNQNFKFFKPIHKLNVR